MSESDIHDGSATQGTAPGGGDLVRDAFQAFEKVRRLRRLYDASHRLSREAVTDLEARFGRAVDAHRILHVDVHPGEFEYEGRPVLDGGGRDDSVPARLHRDGVRTLTFRAGLDFAELIRLIDLLEPGDSRSGDEDLATELWQQGFDGIEYSAVDEIGFGEDNTGRVGTASQPDEMEERIQEIVSAILSARPSDAGLAHGGIRVTADRSDLLHAERHAAAADVAADTDLAFLALPEETLAGLRAEGADDDGSALVDRALRILFDVIEKGEAEVDAAGLAALLGPFLRAGLSRGEPGVATRVLHRVEELVGGAPGHPLAGLPLGLAAELGRRPNLELMLRAPAIDVGALEDLLGRLPADALPELALAAGDLVEGPVADLLHSVIRDRGGEAPGALLAFASSLDDAAAVELLCDALHRTDARNLPSVVTAVLGHENERVACEAIAVAKQLPTVTRREVIGRGLSDPRSAVRTAACIAAESSGESIMLDVLAGLLDSGLSTGAEKTAVVHAIATFGGRVAADVLKRHLSPRRGGALLGRKMTVERLAAVASLHDVTDPDVRRFLAEGMHSKDRRFADTCRAALGGGPA